MTLRRAFAKQAKPSSPGGFALWIARKTEQALKMLSKGLLYCVGIDLELCRAVGLRGLLEIRVGSDCPEFTEIFEDDKASGLNPGHHVLLRRQQGHRREKWVGATLLMSCRDRPR